MSSYVQQEENLPVSGVIYVEVIYEVIYVHFFHCLGCSYSLLEKVALIVLLSG